MDKVYRAYYRALLLFQSENLLKKRKKSGARVLHTLPLDN